jgi:hypothetical protein
MAPEINQYQGFRGHLLRFHRWLARANQAYDELERCAPTERFLLFVIPMFTATLVDASLSLIYGWPTFVFILIMIPAAVFRILGTAQITIPR